MKLDGASPDGTLSDDEVDAMVEDVKTRVKARR